MPSTTYVTQLAGNAQQPPHVNRPQPGPARPGTAPYPAPNAGPRIGQNPMRPGPFAQSSWPGAANQPTPTKRRKPVVLIVLLLVLTVAAGTFGTLYFTAMSDTTSAEAAVAAKDKELRDAKADAAAATDAKEEAESARAEAEDKAATAESAKDSAEATAQRLEACKTASQELLTALRGDPNAQATEQAVATALGKMSISCG